MQNEVMQNIADILPHALKKQRRSRTRSQQSGSDLLTVGMLRAHWAHIVGEPLTQRCQPLRLDRGTLWLAVSNSSWRYRLEFQREHLLQQVQQFLGNADVSSIRLGLAREPLVAAEPPRSTSSSQEPRLSPEIGASKPASIHERNALPTETQNAHKTTTDVLIAATGAAHETSSAEAASSESTPGGPTSDESDPNEGAPKAGAPAGERIWAEVRVFPKKDLQEQFMRAYRRSRALQKDPSA